MPRDGGETSVRNGPPTKRNPKKKAERKRAAGKYWGRAMKQTVGKQMRRDQKR